MLYGLPHDLPPNTWTARVLAGGAGDVAASFLPQSGGRVVPW